MTTETPPAIDPLIEAWSDRLEEDLTEAGMETQQARAYRLAFELGLTRVISQTATKQELQDGLLLSRQELLLTKQELKDAIADLRNELHREIDRLERWLILIGGAAIGLLITLVVRSFA